MFMDRDARMRVFTLKDKSPVLRFNAKSSTTKLRAAINGNIGRDVRVLTSRPSPDDFHARYSALEKTYVYRIVNGPVIRRSGGVMLITMRVRSILIE